MDAVVILISVPARKTYRKAPAGGRNGCHTGGGITYSRNCLSIGESGENTTQIYPTNGHAAHRVTSIAPSGRGFTASFSGGDTYQYDDCIHGLRIN